MVEHELVSFATIIILWTLVTFLLKVIRILLKWKYTQDKNNAILAATLKTFRPGHSGWSVHTENFHPGYRNLGRKNRDLGKQASPASHMNTSKFLQRKE